MNPPGAATGIYMNDSDANRSDLEKNSRPFVFLIVEIDLASRAQIEGWIRDARLGEVCFAADIASVLKVLETQKIDCIIGSWDLLGLAKGISLLKLIKLEERFERIAFVMISSPSPDEAEKVRSARAARADGYLLKPLNESVMKALLAEIRAKQK